MAGSVMAGGGDPAGEFDVRALLEVVRRRWWVVAIVSGVALVVALGLSMSQTDQYATASQVRITDPSASAVFDGGIGAWRDPEREIATQLEVLGSPRLEQQVIERMGEDWTLVSGVTFTGVGGTDTLRIRATSEVPSIAQAAANTYADVYVLDRRERVSGGLAQKAEELRKQVAQIDGQISEIDAQISAGGATGSAAVQGQISDLEAQRNSLLRQQESLTAQAASTQAQAAANPDNPGLSQTASNLRVQAANLGPQIDALDAQLTQLRTQLPAGADGEDVDDLASKKQALLTQQAEFKNRISQMEVEAAVREGDVEVIAEADLPGAPFAPTPEKDAVLSLVLGVMVGLGIVFLLERLDDRIDLGDDIEAIAGAPLLGSVLVDSPKKRQKAGALPKAPRHLVSADSVDSEAYRTLATSLRFSSLGREKQIVAVTSASGSEGKSTITANLAASLTDAGLRVVLVSADLRRPSIGEVFQVAEGSLGLSSVLVGDATVDDALVAVSLPSGNAMQFLPSGPVPPNPAELLGSRRMAGVLAEIVAGEVDYLLIDCPPILPVSDVLALSQYLDGVVLVTVPGRTRSGQLSEAADRLHKVGASILGVILNGVPRTPGRYGYYHYYRKYERGSAVAEQRSDVSRSDSASRA